jgi:hypothetical protein
MMMDRSARIPTVLPALGRRQNPTERHPKRSSMMDRKPREPGASLWAAGRLAAAILALATTAQPAAAQTTCATPTLGCWKQLPTPQVTSV